MRPDDIVLVDRNCHKSHHYGLVLAGAQVAYLDSYPLDQYSMYGAVPIRHIKETLLGFSAPARWTACAWCCSPTAPSTASSTTSSA